MQFIFGRIYAVSLKYEEEVRENVFSRTSLVLVFVFRFGLRRQNCAHAAASGKSFLVGRVVADNAFARKMRSRGAASTFPIAHPFAVSPAV